MKLSDSVHYERLLVSRMSFHATLFLFFLFVSLLKRLFNIRTVHIKYVIVQYELIEIRA